MTDIALYKNKWMQGEWDNEPDKINWIDESTDLDCMIVRNQMGALCGYVGVPKDHPLYNVGYDDVNVRVHGGLTYANACSGHVCHLPEEGRPDDVWWFGFDCAHHGDVIPAMEFTAHMGTYCNLEYVKNQVTGLAEQIAEFVNVKSV